MSSEVEPVTDFVTLFDKWKAEHQNEGYDPLPFLTRCSEILESALVEFHEGRPDPFDQRHPARVVPGCRLGTALELLQNCKEFKDTLISTYLKTNESPKNVGRVVIASAKLVLLARIGYRIAGLDTEEWVNVLICWIIYANEPLRTYATGLIDGRCVVKSSSNDKSIKLITTLLKRLWNYVEPDTYKETECIVLNDKHNESNPRKRKRSSDFISERNRNFVVGDGDITDKNRVNELNDSSYVEKLPSTPGVNDSMEKPLTTSLCQVCQCYAFALLKCFGGLPEFRSAFDECNVLPLIIRHLRMKSEDRLVYNVLKFLNTLFIHNETATDFIELGGIQKLIDIPRPSTGSSGVALCLYNLARRKEAMEKICHSQAHILRELLEYAVLLLECPRDSVKSNIAMFFSEIFSYRHVLLLFDEMNGLSYLIKMISTTKYITHIDDEDYDPLEDPDFPNATSHLIKPACVALSKYFEAHTVFKIGELMKSNPDLKHKYPSIEFVTQYESATYTRVRHLDYFDALRELGNGCYNFNLESWEPIALFQRLDGVPLLLYIIQDTHEFAVTMPAQYEVCRAALDVLRSVTLSQPCQVTLAECHPDFGLDVIGLNVVLNLIETFLNINNATYTDGVSVNSAIAVIANCTEFTCTESSNDTEPLEVHSAPLCNNSTREVKETLWKLIRQADGMHTLISLLGVTKPARTADETRYFASKALVGLAEYRPVREILPKLHVLTSKLHEAILKPIRKDKKQLHVKFCNNVKLLLKRIVTRRALTLDADWKTVMTSNVASKTRARYDNEDFLMIIYIALFLSDPRRKLGVGTFPNADDTIFVSPQYVRNLESNKGFIAENSEFSESNHIARCVTLNSLIEECSNHEHSECRNPVIPIPPFSLFTHRRGSKPMNKNEASINIQKRHRYRQGVYHEWDGVRHELRMIYSRFRPAGEIRPTRDRNSRFTSVAFNHNDDSGLILGDSAGNFHFPKAQNIEDRVKTGVFDSAIISIEPSYAGDVMLTLSSNWCTNNCVLLGMGNTFDVKVTFDSIEYVELSKTVQNKIVATSISTQAIIYDLNTGTAINTYGNDVGDETYIEDNQSCSYQKNRATFSYDDRLVLSDGCFWDVRKHQTLPVHRFDKFNHAISGVFHPNGFEVIINTEVWDMRNLKLIRSVPALDQCKLIFNRNRSVMYAIKIDTEERPGLMSSFRTFDTSNYEQLGFISAKQQVYALALDDWDRNVAVIETPNAGESSVSVCRMYEVGMMREDDGGEGKENVDSTDDNSLHSDDEITIGDFLQVEV